MSRIRLANAFPLPFAVPVVTSADVGWNTLYPVGLTLDQVIEAYWRVRRWKVTEAVTLDEVGYVYAGTSTYGSTPGGGPPAPVPATERDLIAPPVSTETDTLGASGSPQFSFWLFLNDEVGGWLAPAVQTGGLWYPAAFFGTPDYGTTSGHAPSGAIQMTLLGQPVGCGVEGSNPIGGSVVIEPAEYWPYTGADGTAIYDTTSGAALQNPVGAAYP